MRTLLLASALTFALPLLAQAETYKVPADIAADGTPLAGAFHIAGQAQMITPPLLAQYLADGHPCGDLKTASGATVGGLSLVIMIDPKPVVATETENSLISTYTTSCSMALTLGGQPLIDSETPSFGQTKEKAPDGSTSVQGYSAEGVYVIGSAPYALAVVDVGDDTEGDHKGDFLFKLYVVRNGKPLEVFQADSKDALDASLQSDILTLSNVNRVHGDECEACTVPESMSFNIDPAAGRVRWHAPTPRAAESVQYWLKEADPAYRAKEEADEKAQEAAFKQKYDQQQAQQVQDKISGWYVLNARTNECVSPSERNGMASPAEVIQGDAASGLNDNVNITQRDEAGNPVAVEVDEPANGNLVNYYLFYKGDAACEAAATAKTNSLKGLN